MLRLTVTHTASPDTFVGKATYAHMGTLQNVVLQRARTAIPSVLSNGVFFCLNHQDISDREPVSHTVPL